MGNILRPVRSHFAILNFRIKIFEQSNRFLTMIILVDRYSNNFCKKCNKMLGRTVSLSMCHISRGSGTSA